MKKKWISLLLGTIMTFSLVGCGSSNAKGTATGEKGTTESNGAKVIEVWSNNRHDEDYMTEMINKFNADHSDIQIKYTILSDDWKNSIQLAYQANTAPDVITVAASDELEFNDYVKSGILMNLSDYIAADETFQKVTEVYDHKYEGLNSIGDDIYWVANGVRSGSRIEYNEELISKVGYTEIPETLEELVTLAADITAQGNGVEYGVGFTSASPLSRWLEGVGEMSGYNHNGYDYKTGTYDFSQWKDLVETAAKFFEQGSVLPGSETQGVDNSRALFAQGSFGIWGNASQEAGVFTKQFPTSFEWGVAELPTVTGEVKGALNMTPNFGFAMLGTCEDKDAAWEVIKYFSSEEFLKGYFEKGYSAPLSDYMTGVIDTEKVGRLADFDIKDYEDVYPSTPAITVEGDDFKKVLWSAILGSISADDAIADLNKRYNDALEKGLKNGTCTRLIIEDYDPLHPSSGTYKYMTE